MSKYRLEGLNECLDNTVYNEIANGYVEVKKSKFYSYIFNVSNLSINDIKNKIEEIRKDNKKARHLLYAYEINIDNVKHMKFCNDGEPQGTGVNSVISMLEKEEITDYLVVMVRYYGGILLGSGPLLRTYLSCFKEAFLKCKKYKL